MEIPSNNLFVKRTLEQAKSEAELYLNNFCKQQNINEYYQLI